MRRFWQFVLALISATAADDIGQPDDKGF